MPGVAKLRLFKYLIAALFIHVVFVYSNVVEACATSCASR